MAQVITCSEIRGDPQAIFELVTTAKYWTDWHPATLAVSGQIERPMKVGDVIRERARIGASVGENDWTVTVCEPPRRVVLEMPGTRLGDLKISYLFEPAEERVLFTRELQYDASAFPAEQAAQINAAMQNDSQVATERIKAMVQEMLAVRQHARRWDTRN
jgi:hypothetical protein